MRTIKQTAKALKLNEAKTIRQIELEGLRLWTDECEIGNFYETNFLYKLKDGLIIITKVNWVYNGFELTYDISGTYEWFNISYKINK